MASNDVDFLLSQWESTYKKGLLSFWILLLLSENKAYPYEMKNSIVELSQNTVSVDENSIYRALNRLAKHGVVDSQIQPSDTGPDRRYYFLTGMGKVLLARFITRNILVFQHPAVADLIQKNVSNVTSQ